MMQLIIQLLQQIIVCKLYIQLHMNIYVLMDIYPINQGLTKCPVGTSGSCNSAMAPTSNCYNLVMYFMNIHALQDTM